MPLDDSEVRERVAKVETLLAEVESLPDDTARSKAVETVQAVLELYGEGLARVMAHARQAGAGLTRPLADDDLVSHLLLLHDLHPDDLETRVRRALDGVRPHLQSNGGNVELLGVAEGVVRLRLDGSFGDGLLSAVSLKNSIEEAVHDAAPDIDRIEAEGELAAAAADEAAAAAGAQGSAQQPAFIPLSAIGVGGGPNGRDEAQG